MELILRFLFNLIAIAGVIAIVFKLDAVKKTFVISLAIFNLVIFCLSLIFRSQELSLGSGLGLFALFTLIRYRSEPLRITELSYILICACLGIMNAIFPDSWGFLELFGLNMGLVSVIALALWIFPMEKTDNCYKIRYDRLELLKPEYRITLFNDLQQKLGLEIDHVEIESINYPDHYANLKVTMKTGSIAKQTSRARILPRLKNYSKAV